MPLNQGHRIIENPRSIIIACDVGVGREGRKRFREILRKTNGLNGVGAYQVSGDLGLDYGLKKAVSVIKSETGKPVIYEHDTLGSGMPKKAKGYSEVLAEAGVSGTYIFPIDGDLVGDEWATELDERGPIVIVRGIQSYPRTTTTDGGHLEPHYWRFIYDGYLRKGIRHFQMPANRREDVSSITRNLEAAIPARIPGISEGVPEIVYYATGFGEQGGKLGDITDLFGQRTVHPTFGGRVCNAADVRGEVQKILEEFNAALDKVPAK